MSAIEEIDSIIKQNDVVLFMKGTKYSPICGFSSFVCRVLNSMNVEYKDVNVLMDEEVRQAIKDYSQWPTIPQLYIKEEFIGGCDIVKELLQSEEFYSFFDKHSIPYTKLQL